jgi:hypothetical protein
VGSLAEALPEATLSNDRLDDGGWVRGGRNVVGGAGLGVLDEEGRLGGLGRGSSRPNGYRKCGLGCGVGSEEGKFGHGEPVWDEREVDGVSRDIRSIVAFLSASFAFGWRESFASGLPWLYSNHSVGVGPWKPSTSMEDKKD